jgi:hypothetical protein
LTASIHFTKRLNKTALLLSLQLPPNADNNIKQLVSQSVSNIPLIFQFLDKLDTPFPL